MDLTETIRRISALGDDLVQYEVEAKKRSEGIRAQIAELKRQVALDGAMLDADKITLARTILHARGTFAKGGEDRHSVIRDAIAFFAIGPQPYKDLRKGYFGTKNYDRWSGQRSDHPYFMGPSHGSICFAIEMTKSAQDRADLTAEEVEACLYFLTRLEAVQAAEAEARAAA